MSSVSAPLSPDLAVHPAPRSPALGTPLPQDPSMPAHDCVYLDYNATTPIFPEVADAMLPFLRYHFGNPSSGHVVGRCCRDALSTARARVAAMIGADGADGREIVFTSCGTESDNMVLRGCVAVARRDREAFRRGRIHARRNLHDSGGGGG